MSKAFARESYLFYRRLLERAAQGEDMTLVLVTGCEPAQSLVGAKFALKGPEIVDEVIPVPFPSLAELKDVILRTLRGLSSTDVDLGASPTAEIAGGTPSGSDEGDGKGAIGAPKRSVMSTKTRNAGFTMTVEFRGVRIQTYAERLYRQPEVIILGGGHVSRALCPVMKTLGFEVTVVDDRPEFASRTWFPHADRLISKSFAEALREIELGDRSYVVIVTRGHRCDQECLEAVLKKPVAYIGMIGSKKKVEGALSLAKEHGFTDDYLRRIYAPIGIDIAAQTPEEIAISIAAEVIKVMRGGAARSLSDDRRSGFGLTSADASASGSGPAVTGQIYGAKGVSAPVPQAAGTWPNIQKGLEGPFAMATVIWSEGSVPRQPGARMLVLRDGTIRDTIGGGSGEASVRQAALEVIESGRPEVVQIDLTGHYEEPFSTDGSQAKAEEAKAQERLQAEGGPRGPHGTPQGVCGGSFRVFIERLDPDISAQA
ncbi:MAG TPA: hypothetical protein GX507_11000 [Clostridia bacterium]|nr:hypothetical protein [Clostridia bacterium]